MLKLKNLLSEFRARRDNRQRYRTLQKIRKHAAWFGISLDHLTDKEIEKGVLDFAKSIQQSGVTAQQAIDAFRKIRLTQK